MNLLQRFRHHAPLRRLLLPAVSRHEAAEAAADADTLDPFAYFPGNTRAWGIVQGRRGDVLRRFEATLNGRIERTTLIIDEQFHYADGERHARTWRVDRDKRGRLAGHADDIIGVAAGTSNGIELYWRYILELEFRGRQHRVHFDDRMWQLDANVIVNRSTIRKFGLRLADVTIFMQKTPA